MGLTGPQGSTEERRTPVTIDEIVRRVEPVAKGDAALEALAGMLAIAWLVRAGDPYDHRRVEAITWAILETLERQR